jgi:ubiquinone/menaquinone biosynthesis C-methylase UbiE
MARQREAFLNGEADRWYERNREALRPERDDIVLDVMRRLALRPGRILEVGAADGWRLERLRRETGAVCHGVEPSTRAVRAGGERYPHIHLHVGTADSLPFADGEFDCVVLGFCFYLVDPALHFRVVAEMDRVLADNGHLVIFDFLPPVPYANPYSHLDGVKTHKMAFSRYFLAHPSYALVHRELKTGMAAASHPDEREGVDVLVKQERYAFPDNPFSPGE